MGSHFVLPGFAKQAVPFLAARKRLGFRAQLFCLFSKPLFERGYWGETVMLEHALLHSG